AVAGVDDVVAVAPGDRVVADHAVEAVVAVVARDRVVAGAALHDVGARAAGVRVGPRTPEGEHRPGHVGGGRDGGRPGAAAEEDVVDAAGRVGDHRAVEVDLGRRTLVDRDGVAGEQVAGDVQRPVGRLRDAAQGGVVVEAVVVRDGVLRIDHHQAVKVAE